MEKDEIGEVVEAIVIGRSATPWYGDFHCYDVLQTDHEERITINDGHYRTPVVRRGVIVWSEQRVPPLLRARDSIICQLDGDIVVWCPSQEMTDATIALDFETAEERETEAHAHDPEIRIILDENEDDEDPQVRWSGWLRRELDTFEGTLPDNLGNYVIQRNDGLGYWYTVPNLEQVPLWIRIKSVRHAKKRASA